MSKPYVICHMMTSLDGRILPKRWRPQSDRGDLYERLHDELGGKAWLVGRISGQEFAKARSYPAGADTRYPREAWIARRAAAAYGVVLDGDGKIAWGRSDVGGDPIVVVLTEKVSDAHLGGLRADGVSYIFAGETQIDLHLALERLRAELGVERLLLEGGGVANGAFLREGLIDELSVIVWPAIDGAAGAPSLFHSGAGDADRLAPIEAMRLLSAQTMESGAVWLRYRLESA